MGIGWTPAHRETVVGLARIGNGDMSAQSTAIVVDGPAAIRGLLFRECSANAVARVFVSQLVRRTAAKSLDGIVVSVLFDMSASMPPQRSVVAASRAMARPSQPLPADFDPCNIVIGHLSRSFDWGPILSTPDTKAAAWEMIGRAVFAALCAIVGCTAEVVTAGAVYVRDVSAALPVRSNVTYGEADLLASTRASEFTACGHDVEIVTVDYDQVLQSLLASTPYACTLRFKKDTINVDNLRGQYGKENRDQLLSAAFFMLCAFKTDYSKGICRLSGTSVTTFVAQMKRTDGVMVISENTTDDGVRHLAFHPHVIKAVTKKWDPVVYVDSFALILWTLAYFAEYDAYRVGWGGPPAVILKDGWNVDPSIMFASDIFSR